VKEVERFSLNTDTPMVFTNGSFLRSSGISSEVSIGRPYHWKNNMPRFFSAMRASR
jgi:hypothetical protein